MYKLDWIGIGMMSVFGRQICFDLLKGFLLIIIKCVYFKLIVYELFWFLQGDFNVCWFQENGVLIWDEWVDEFGDFGLVYGVQWCFWLILDGGSIDQFFEVIEQICCFLDLCRLIVLVWNFVDIFDMVFVFCYVFFQFYVVDGWFLCQFYQCSVDMFFGVLFNIVLYVLFMMMIVQQVGLEFGDFVWMGGDCYIYDNYVEQVCEQLLWDFYFYLMLCFV